MKHIYNNINNNIYIMINDNMINDNMINDNMINDNISINPEIIIKDVIIKDVIIKDGIIDDIIDNELIMPINEYKLIFKTCFCHIIHILLAFYYEMYLCGFMGIILIGTSLNYWRYPLKKSIRRFVDIIWVCITIPYHYYLSIQLTIKLSTILMSIGILMYPLSNYLLYKYKNYKYSAICHCALHVFVSIGACILYKDSYEEYIKNTYTSLKSNDECSSIEPNFKLINE